MATDIRIGTITPTAFYLGAQVISKIYLGSNLVYS